MIVAHGSLAGLPEVTDIIHMIVVKDKLLVILTLSVSPSLTPGDVFVNLTSTNVIKDLTVIKVVQLDPDTTTIVLYPVDSTMRISPSVGLDIDNSFSGSAHTDDTILLIRSSSDSLRRQQWPKLFPIPPSHMIQNVNYRGEMQSLQEANLD
ncbi:hypothetical protein N1851_002913 [Merluccius polli]|uniref:Uncharacterized protein n=1 Tax=Merluccius polli TaxID=89951 RepID=A0AA47NA88_MERPO|nr:hypothetical protein N1851_002913 [Merluccius polli]